MCQVLIIEDEWLIAEHLTDIIQEAGATSITLAATEGEAVEAARERLPQVILSDVMLLEGTGPSAVQAILHEQGPVPVIFITGTPDACRPCSPPSVILTKPIDRRAVVEAFCRFAPPITG